jgi:hypothetical protein
VNGIFHSLNFEIQIGKKWEVKNCKLKDIKEA